MRVFLILALCALALAGCGHGPTVSDSCVRSETGGEFTSNVDGEGRDYYSCTGDVPSSCTFSTRDEHNMPLYVCQ